MALSGTIYGSFTGMSTSKARPYIKWTASQSIANNSSTITATLYFVRYDGYRSWNNDARSFTITIDGSNDTEAHSFDMPGGGSVDTVFSSSKTVIHDDDGGKSITIKASGSTGLSNLGSVSLSGTITLNTIPRASDFTAFTLSNTVLNTSTANTINYTLGRKSSSFSQAMTLKLGSKTIKSWTTSSTGSLTTSLTSTEVNTIISSLPNSTSGTLSLTMQTKSGSSNIGSPKTINEAFTLNSGIAPNASSLSVSIYGSGRDKTLGKYIQNISKVTSSFSRTAGYGASISSSTIVVRRASDNANSQTIASYSGTTANPVSLSGSYEIIATVKDSRGRSDSVSTTITVEAYSPPSITKFTVARGSSTTTTVSNAITATWSPLGTSNPTDISIVGVSNSGTSTTLYTLNDSTAGSLNTTKTYTGQSDASSYTYTITVTDSFGRKATSKATLGTSFIELTISKAKGIGVGKVHEKGSLDVNGDAYVKGFLGIEGVGQGDPDDEGSLRVTGSGKGIKILYGSDVGQGDHSYIEWNKNGVREAYVGFSNDTNSNFHMVNVSDGQDGMFALGNRRFYLINGTATYDGVPVFTCDNELLWSGGIYMQDGQTCTPSKKLSECPNGWILIWGYYDGGSMEQDFNTTIIHKGFVKRHSGRGMWHILQANSTTPAYKYIYVHDDHLAGQARNNDSPQNMQVLREVLSF